MFDEILENETSRILLIHSGSTGRYWAYVDKIQHDKPDLKEIPEYYRDRADKFTTWFRVIRFENAPKILWVNVQWHHLVQHSVMHLSIA